MKKLLCLFLLASSTDVFAAASESAIENTNAKFISLQNYIQNPYAALVSGGGTKPFNESQTADQNFTEKLFADGTWNIQVGASTQYTGSGAGYPNYSYGANLFGQTGSVAGFSLGGLFTAMNPLFATQMNGYNTSASPFLPSNEQVTLSEAYLEYQHSNVIQIDAG